jgi:hypothetical protein
MLWSNPRGALIDRRSVPSSRQRACANSVASMASSSCSTNNRLKLAINSHVGYSRPLKVLLASLHAVAFHRFEDVILVLGGSADNVAPTRESLSSLNLSNSPVEGECCDAEPGSKRTL